MEKISRLSTFAMILMLPMIVYYPYEALSWNLEMSFLDPEKWTRNSRWVDSDAQIALSTRITFFTVWFIPVVLGVLSYLVAFSITLLLRRGIVFDPRVATRLGLMGLLTFLSSTTALLAGAVSPMIRSWHNADGPLPLRFWYDSGNFGLAFCGLAFIFLGLVLHEAIKVARENEEFV